MIPRQGGVLQQRINPAVLPAWLTEADIDYYTAELSVRASEAASIGTATLIGTGSFSRPTQGLASKCPRSTSPGTAT
jgi:hypothetical protein